MHIHLENSFSHLEHYKVSVEQKLWQQPIPLGPLSGPSQGLRWIRNSLAFPGTLTERRHRFGIGMWDWLTLVWTLFGICVRAFTLKPIKLYSLQTHTGRCTHSYTDVHTHILMHATWAYTFTTFHMKTAFNRQGDRCIRWLVFRQECTEASQVKLEADPFSSAALPS